MNVKNTLKLMTILEPRSFPATTVFSKRNGYLRDCSYIRQANAPNHKT